MRANKKSTPTSLKALAAVAGVLAAVAAASIPLFWYDPAPAVPTIDAEAADTVPIPLADDGPVETYLPPANPPSIADDEIRTGHRTGERAPAFTLETFTGETVSLADLRGQIVILDFWASWCRPCRLSMPRIERIAAQFAEREVVLLGVSLDRTRRAAEAYLADLDSPHMLAVWSSYSDATRVAERYGIIGIPHTFLIDREGVVRFTGHPNHLQSADIERLL
jgi:peroxiredoxin